MSILLGPYDKNDAPKKAQYGDELLVFGYACKLYRDDAKAILENSGQLLIPWMGDNSLMVDRYDVRNKLEDKAQFGLKSNLSHRRSAEERDLREELDRERYLALEWDEIRVEEQEEEEKRRRESGFSAIGFVYKDSTPAAKPIVDISAPLPEQLSTDDEQDMFVPPPGLITPADIQMPATNKLHSIIEKTASFTSKQGTQMEIIIKTKQQSNPLFSFLNYNDPLFPYYRHLKDMIRTGGYRPVPRMDSSNGFRRGGGFGVVGQTEDSGRTRDFDLGASAKALDTVGGVKSSSTVKEEETSTVKEQTSTVKEENSTVKEENADADSGSDSDDSDGGGYLHPLLMAKASKPAVAPPTATKSTPPTSTTSPPPTSSNWVALNSTPTSVAGNGDKKLSVEELLGLHTSSSFSARSMAFNSAPVLSSGLASRGEATTAKETFSNAETLAAYEHYKQQFYGSSAPPPLIGPGQAAAGYSCYPSGNPPHDAVREGQEQFLTNGGQSLYPDQYGAAYHGNAAATMSQQQFPVPPADLRPIVDKTAEYVAKNSDDFERTVLEKHISDPRFSFLNPWGQHHAYYAAMKQFFKTKNEQEKASLLGAIPMPPEEAIKVNVQKLSSSGAISFKLQSKVGVAAAPGELPGPCSQFNKEDYLEREEGTELEEENGAEQEGFPEAKKQRLDSNGDDDIGSTVQAFLSTVKDMFGTEATDQ